MMNNIKIATLAALFASWFGAVAAADVDVPPNAPAIKYIGRFTDDYRCAWTGSAVEVEFTGVSSVAAHLELVSKSAKGVAFETVLDGKQKVIVVRPGQETYPLADGLAPDKRHRLLIFRRSEACFGTVRFKGLRFSPSMPGAPLLAKPRTAQLKIHIIGDSITCGYGSEAKTIEEGNTITNENAYMAYGPVAARELDADIMMTCWSGKGMYRNRYKTNDLSETIPLLFDYALPVEKVKCDNAKFIPDVFIINLGTNDLARNGKPSLDRDKFCAAYEKFIAKLRSYAPKSKIILAFGPMAGAPVDAWLKEIAAKFDDCQVLLFDNYKNKDEIGGHYHPSVKKHAEMAAKLVETIKKMLQKR